MTSRRAAARVALTPANLWQLVKETFKGAIEYRVTGLAAEAAFFTILSLPPLIFGLAGAIGFVVQTLDVGEIDELRNEVLALASQLLTTNAIDEVIAPTLDDVLAGGRADIISIGFVIALWSGSRAMNVVIDTISIIYGKSGIRSLVRMRALSFVVYLAILLVAALMIPLVLAGPGVIAALLPMRLRWLIQLYWPTVLLGSVALLTTVFHRAVPERTRWRADLPGAFLTMGLWTGGSWLLRQALSASLGSTSLYGPLAAPIALLAWFYVMAIALLIGAAFNAACERVWPGIAGRVAVPEQHEPDVEAQRRIHDKPV